MDKVRSKDGTLIAYEASGSGPPLLLIHGGGSHPDRWKSILPRFEPRYTLYRVTRRGRGESGDAPEYSLQREAEDIAAVVEATGEDVDVLGHSYGALCALEAALLTRAMRKLILYEPPLPISGPVVPPDLLLRLQAMLDTGDRDGAWATFNREVVHMPDSELQIQRAQAAHAARLAAVHTIVREVVPVNAYKLDPQRFAGLSIPVLLLTGSDSPAFLQQSAAAVHAALPKSRLVVLRGQGHVAMDTAPDLFVREVTTFLQE